MRARPTAVIIDDDPDVRHVLARVFEASGVDAITADGGEDGLRAVFETQPLITSIDLTMPGIDGFEVTRRIRQSGIDTHIMVITATRNEPDVVLGLKVGADQLLHKPLRVRELRARIEAIVQRAGDAPEPFGLDIDPADLRLVEPEVPPLNVTWDALSNAPEPSRDIAVDVRLNEAELALLDVLTSHHHAAPYTSELARALRALPLQSTHRPNDEDGADVRGHLDALREKLGIFYADPRDEGDPLF